MDCKQSLAMRYAAATVLAIACLSLSGQARAAYKIGDDTNYLKIGALLQTWATMDEKKAPDADSWENEFYLRRMRLMFSGQLSDKVNFFVETDNPNFGKAGDLSMDTFIQDAYLELNVHEMLQVDIGMILLPFSHQGMQGATSLMPIEYHIPLIKYPSGSHKVWRDFGVMLRGIFFGKWLEYRFGIFNGVHGNSKLLKKTSATDATVTWEQYTDPRNDADWPRLTGRLTFNLFDAEGGAGLGGFFYDGIYLEKKDIGIVSTKKILSVGGSVDWQKDLNVKLQSAPLTADTTLNSVDRKAASLKDYMALNADVFADIPLDINKLWSVTGQVNFYYYDYGDRRNANAWYNDSGDTTSFTGVGISSELGVRYSAFEPLVLFDWFDSTKANGNAGDYLGIFGGFNYWLLAHAVSFKAQFGAIKAGTADKKEEWRMGGALQAQLLF